MPVNYNRYPADWFTRLHRIVWDRAQGKCEVCGLEHGQTVYSHRVKMYRKGKTVYRVILNDTPPSDSTVVWKAVKVILTKAHLDHDAENKNVHPSRLKLMCQLDHLRYDAWHKAQKRNQPKPYDTLQINFTSKENQSNPTGASVRVQQNPG